MDYIAGVRRWVGLAMLTGTMGWPGPVDAQIRTAPYTPIEGIKKDRTITITGQGMTIEQVVDVAREGATVRVSAEALQHSADAYGLLLEGAAEGVPIYWFNRGGGTQRETVIFAGDPTTTENSKLLATRTLKMFERGAKTGYGPELNEEQVVRGTMVVRLNTMVRDAASPEIAKMLTEMLNRRVTPVMQSRGTIGEGDLGPMGNIAAVMVGKGEAYVDGERMSAARALSKAGLETLRPSGADDAAMMSTNALAEAQAVFLVKEARGSLEWADLVYAMELNGMNSSVTPLALPVRSSRGYRWPAWDAERVLAMLKGSYLLNDDPHRIIQDPESLRAGAMRQGAAWQAWAQLRDDVEVAINSSDHNPLVSVGTSPHDGWEMGTPQMMKYFVKGGTLSHGMHGYILSNANWDPYPLANDVEAFTVALANMDASVVERLDRFRNTFFTGISAADVLTSEQLARSPQSNLGMVAADLFQQVQGLVNPVAPAGFALINTVEDLEGQTRLKIARGREAVDLSINLLAMNLMNATFWMDVRRAERPERSFGAGPTAVLTAFRTVVPWQQSPDKAPDRPIGKAALDFIKSHAAVSYAPRTVAEPDGRTR